MFFGYNNNWNLAKFLFFSKAEEVSRSSFAIRRARIFWIAISRSAIVIGVVNFEKNGLNYFTQRVMYFFKVVSFM